MTHSHGRRRRDTADDTVAASEDFEIPEMSEDNPIFNRPRRDVTKKAFYKDYVGKSMPHQVRIVGGDTSRRGVSRLERTLITFKGPN